MESSTDLTDHNEKWLADLEKFQTAFEEAMNDDFNTANAITDYIMLQIMRINIYWKNIRQQW
ncbi:DALR domain-containing protein [Bacillus cereus]|uniref:DALR domain-containing protein n=1 Tax=Bacillus cereus TaxID=1396 RepID=UPI000A7EEACF|nr:DALR domain-containing protein [Bacillus cereus]